MDIDTLRLALLKHLLKGKMNIGPDGYPLGGGYGDYDTPFDQNNVPEDESLAALLARKKALGLDDGGWRGDFDYRPDNIGSTMLRGPDPIWMTDSAQVYQPPQTMAAPPKPPNALASRPRYRGARTQEPTSPPEPSATSWGRDVPLGSARYMQRDPAYSAPPARIVAAPRSMLARLGGNMDYWYNNPHPQYATFSGF